MAAKRSLSRRARAVMLWGVVWCIAAQLAAGWLLHARPEIADVEFGRKLADVGRLATGAPGRPLVLMFGSSRMATGFRPDSLDEVAAPGPDRPIVYNFAQVGSGPEMAHLSLQRLLDAGIRPGWVFLEFWPPTWGAERNLKEFLDQINVGCLSWGGVELLGRYVTRPRRLYREWCERQLIPMFGERAALLRQFAPAWSLSPAAADRRCRDLDSLGWWSPMATVEPAERARLEERYRNVYERRLLRFRVEPTPDRALREFVALCRREGIRATVVILPEGQPFRRLYPPEALRKVRAYLDRVARECGVAVVDARGWVGDDGFMDGHHLLPEGAQVFSRRLGTEVLQPLLAGSPPELRR
jgi:hypothetical protein